MGALDGWRFCPRCGGSVTHSDNHVRCDACGYVVWANPAPAVQALAERDGRLLLARRAFEPRAGFWDLPGGFVDEREEPFAALERELREETGLGVEHAEFLGIWTEPDYDGRTVLALTWRALLGAGEPRAADDVAELRWFAAGELPRDDELAFTHFPALLRLWEEHAQRPWPHAEA